jgi:hypothetical protein
MSLGDALKFEKSWVGDIWKGIKKDPKRLVLGVDPLSTKAWNAVLGRNDKPVVGDFGGPTKESYQNAQDKGIQTGTASTLHGIAKAVAGVYGGYGAAGGLGNAAGSLVSSSSFTPAAGGIGSGTTGAGYGVAGGAAEAIPEVVVTGTTGSGLGTAATGAGVGAGGATAANSNSNGQSWRDQMQMPGQQDDSQAQADENRRQLEMMMEQERLRRESFRRSAIARAMGS